MPRARTLLGAGVLLLGALALFQTFRPEAEAAPMQAFTSSAQCAECHAEPFAEWQGSWHAQAWSDPDVRALSNEFANTDCIDCHAPRPVFETGIGQRVLPRSIRRAEGVDCIACHSLPGPPESAGVAGTLDNPAAACRPRAVRDLASVEFCAACHDQHKTVEQWRATPFAAQKRGCIDCHMPFRDGDPNRGRDHRMHGGHDLELVRSAVTLRARREGARVQVEIENTGAGHHFPTDERSRAADLFWRPLAPAGGPWIHLHRLRSPYRHEVDLVDTLLAFGETRRVAIDDPRAAGAIEVALFYKLTPYWKDPAQPDPEAEARLVHRLALDP